MKKTIAIVLSLILCLGLLAGCGKSAADDKTITVAASPTPHAEILAVAKEVLAKEGWTLVITEYSDYVIPNNVVEDGEIDANYFQHVPYLSTFNAENGTHLVSVAMVHYEPFGIYAGTKSDLAELAEGDKIAIPNDGSNRARALLLLEAEGIITLTTILGYGAMAGIIGGGGLGKIAIQYGLYNFRPIVMWAAVIGLVLLVQIFQTIGTKLATACDKRLKNRS